MKRSSAETRAALVANHGFPEAGGEVPDFGRHDLAALVDKLEFTHGAEIGVERGLYSEVLLDEAPALNLLSVDPWLRYGSYREHVSQAKLTAFETETRARLARFGGRSTVTQGFSVQVAACVDDCSLDFVYIDANHDLAHVIQDIAAWLPKIRPGGIMAGHDYVRRNEDVTHHVVQAVQAWTQCYGVAPWWVLGRRARREGETRDKNRSWMWVV